MIAWDAASNPFGPGARINDPGHYDECALSARAFFKSEHCAGFISSEVSVLEPLSLGTYRVPGLRDVAYQNAAVEAAASGAGD